MPDGTIAYTRDGSFEVLHGQLVTSSGLSVANGITIPNGTTKVSISARRGVSCRAASHAAQVGTIRDEPVHQSGRPGASRPKPLSRRWPPGSPSRDARHQRPGHASAGLSGSLERQCQELVTMIQTQRAYEMNSKAIQTSDQMLAKLASSEPLLRHGATP
jgi:flagellar basal-body rod protein FlgG